MDAGREPGSAEKGGGAGGVREMGAGVGCLYAATTGAVNRHAAGAIGGGGGERFQRIASPAWKPVHGPSASGRL